MTGLYVARLLSARKHGCNPLKPGQSSRFFMRRTRPLIALAAAYSLVFAAAIGAVAGGEGATFALSLCRASHSLGDQAPAAPAHHHDLGCCVGCTSPASALPPRASTDRAPAFARIAWEVERTSIIHASIERRSLARAPPAGT
jgi:hypothetical protein